MLEEQQQELELLRIAKLRELEKRKARFTERKFKGKNLREHSIFYTTVTLAFFSVSAGASILFLVPLYVGELSTIFFRFCDDDKRARGDKKGKRAGEVHELIFL